MPPVIPSYTGMALKNFRGFKSAEDIKLAPLTFLVGPNSAGKSTISNALLFVAQSNMLEEFLDRSLSPEWIGRFVDLGSFKENVFNHNVRLSVQVCVDVSINPKGDYWFSPEGDDRILGYRFKIRSSDKDTSGKMRSVEIVDHTSDQCLLIEIDPSLNNNITLYVHNRKETFSPRREFYYRDLRGRISVIVEKLVQTQASSLYGKLSGWRRIISHLRSNATRYFMTGTSRVSSGRLGPRRWYVPQNQGQPQIFQRGAAAPLYENLSPELVRDALQSRTIRRGRRRGVKPISAENVLDDLQIADRIDVQNYTPYHSMIHARDNITGVQSNIADIGYGASQVLPVIAACTVDTTSLLVVEQPEVHLHPKAQGTIGELLCHTSKYRQVIVETHSEHLINRARILVARGEIDAKDVAINYVYRNKSGSHTVHIPLGTDGEFGAEWPSGFFDERYEDTMTLLAIKHQKGNSKSEN